MTIAELIKKLSELPPEAEVEVMWIDYDIDNDIQMSTQAVAISFEADEGDNGTAYIGELL